MVVNKTHGTTCSNREGYKKKEENSRRSNFLKIFIMEATPLTELMKRANPLLAHKITILSKLGDQRKVLINSIINYNISMSSNYHYKETSEKVTEIKRIDEMIMKILNKPQK